MIATTAEPTNRHAETCAAPPERDANGRFVKGNACGRGNPYARQCAALRKAASEVVTEQDAIEIMHAAMIRAKCGDMAAARFVFSYAIGRPGDAPDPDRLDVEEWKLFQESVVSVEEARQPLGGTHLDFVNAVVPPAVQCKTIEHFKAMQDGFASRDEEERQRAQQAAAGTASAPSPAAANGSKPQGPRPAAERSQPSTNRGDGQAPAPHTDDDDPAYWDLERFLAWADAQGGLVPPSATASNGANGHLPPRGPGGQRG